MKKEEYVKYFIDHINNTFPLLPYQEEMLEELLNKEYDKQMEILKPKFTSRTQALFTESRNPDSLKMIEEKLAGRSPIQFLIDDMQIKHTL